MTAPNTLPTTGLPGGCQGSCAGPQLLTKWKLSLLQARKFQSLLPDLMELMLHSSLHITLKALQVIQSIMGHLNKREASPRAVQLLNMLQPLLDSVRLMWEPEP